MRISSALIALSLLLIACSAGRALAAGEILPPCSPFGATSPRLLDGARAARVRTLRDSLVTGLQSSGSRATPRSEAERPVHTTSASGGDWEFLNPMPWFASTMVADPPHDRLVLFGGQNSLGQPTSVWMRALGDAGNWAMVPISGPRPAFRSDGAAIYDPQRNRMIIFGGAFSDGVWALSLTDSPAWTQLALAGSGPAERQGNRAVYDPTGDRLIVFGGYTPPAYGPMWGDVWSFALGDSSGWSQVSPAGTGPTSRGDGAVVFDSRRHRLLLYSGCDWGANSPQSPSIPDLWALSLDATTAWTRLSAGGDAPPPLYATAAAYDSLHDRMVVYGGQEYAVGAHREAWVLNCGDTLGWTRVLPDSAPGARMSACLAFDMSRDRFVMFGGAGSDTWALSLSSEPRWKVLEPGGPEPANTGYFAASAYDPVQHRSLMLGGVSQYPADYSWWHVSNGDLWSLAGASSPRWSSVAPDNSGPAYVGESMVVDTRGNRAIAFAGFSYSDGTIGSLSELPLAGPFNWSPMAAAGVLPLPREHHSAIYDAARARMVIFGGRGSSGAFNDTWLLSLGDTPQWTRTDSVAAAPPVRFGQSTIYDPVGDRMIIFGGANGAGYFGDVWQLSLADPPRWTPLNAGTGPSPRIFASMVYDSRRQRIVLIGGLRSDGSPLADVWFLPLADGAGWIRADSASFVPGPRWGAAATYDPDHDYVFVGFGVSDPCNFGYYEDSWIFRASDDASVSPVASVISSNPGAVVLRWSGLPTSGCTGTVQRRAQGGAWTTLAQVSPGPDGTVEYVDRSAAPGETYDFRLQWFAGALAGTSADLSVRVVTLRFALVVTNANPSHDGLSVAFSLPDAAPAQIGIYDIAGRELVQREVGAEGPGDHLMRLLAPGALRPGVYLVRLKHGGSARVVRASVLQ